MEAIKRDFGSFENFKEKFSASTIAVQGSGWGWLVSQAIAVLCSYNNPGPHGLCVVFFAFVCRVMTSRANGWPFPLAQTRTPYKLLLVCKQEGELPKQPLIHWHRWHMVLRKLWIFRTPQKYVTSVGHYSSPWRFLLSERCFQCWI